MKELRNANYLPIRNKPYVLLGKRQQRRVDSSNQAKSLYTDNDVDVAPIRERVTFGNLLNSLQRLQEPESSEDIHTVDYSDKNNDAIHLEENNLELREFDSDYDEITSSQPNTEINLKDKYISKNDELNELQKEIAKASFTTHMNHTQVTAVLKALKTHKNLK